MLPLSETRPHGHGPGCSMQRQEGQGEGSREGLTAEASLGLQRLWDLQGPAERAMPHAVITFDSNISFLNDSEGFGASPKKAPKLDFFYSAPGHQVLSPFNTLSLGPLLALSPFYTHLLATFGAIFREI